jgi:hypothetical protein
MNVNMGSSLVTYQKALKNNPQRISGAWAFTGPGSLLPWQSGMGGTTINLSPKYFDQTPPDSPGNLTTVTQPGECMRTPTLLGHCTAPSLTKRTPFHWPQAIQTMPCEMQITIESRLRWHTSLV